MIEEKKRNDFIFFQDEILGELKKMEAKLSEKLSQSLAFIDKQNQKYDNKIQDLTNRLIFLSQKLDENNNTKIFEDSLQNTRQKIEESITKIDVKLNILDKDFNGACFKYDKIIANNLIVPGLIGAACPYDTLMPFLEYTNQKIGELLKAKDKQTIDTKKYKEKLENIISQNKIQYETVQKKFSDYCSQGFKQCDTVCKDRISIIENRIESLRLENGQYAYELKQKTDELQIQWDKITNIENILNKKYKEELIKFNDIVDKLSNKIDKSKEEFHMIKNKFTELSEFIKDVRFKKNFENINDINLEKKQYMEMSNKIDFSKKRKNKKIQNNEIKNEYDALGPYYNNNQEYLNQSNLKQIETNKNCNKLNDNELSSNNYDISVNIIEEPKNKKKENIIIREFDKIDNNEKNKIKYMTFNNEKNYNSKEIKIIKNKNKKDMNEKIMNNSSEFQNVSSNIMSNKKDKKEDNKYINLKKKKFNNNYNDNNNSINSNNDNNTCNIFNYSNKFYSYNKNNNNNNDNQSNNSSKKYEKSREQNKNNFLFLSENAKINELILGADFRSNNLYKLNPTYNLSQAYLLIKRKDEEIKKLRKTQFGKSEPKFNQLTASSILTHSRNFNGLNNFNNNLNNNNNSIYNSPLRKDKLKSIGLNQNNDNFPNIFRDNQNKQNDKIVDYNTININDNNFDNKSLTQKGSKKKKKLLYSSSDRNLLVKFSSKTPFYQEYSSIDNRK